MVKFFKKHWEVLSYLIFGVLTTLLNIVLYALFNKLFGFVPDPKESVSYPTGSDAGYRTSFRS